MHTGLPSDATYRSTAALHRRYGSIPGRRETEIAAGDWKLIVTGTFLHSCSIRGDFLGTHLPVQGGVIVSADS